MATYTIRELSDMFDLPPSTLRYYEELGLLPGVAHTDRKKRVYSDFHVNRLRAVQCYKQTGIPLQKIQLFFEYEKNLPANIDEILDLLVLQEADILQRIQNMEQGLAHVRHKLRYYTGIRQAIADGTPYPRWEDC